jgi:hypothetical protein
MPTLSVMDRDADELQASLSPEAAWGKPKNPEKELALVAFGANGSTDAIVVWCNDGYLRWEIGEQGAVEVASYLLDKEAPDNGIWVWEGKVKWVSGGSWECPEPPEPEYVTICWRQPDDDEWDAIKEQRNPFEPKPKTNVDYYDWGPKTSM